jgi:methyltransferase (TIGR00027 family)
MVKHRGDGTGPDLPAQYFDTIGAPDVTAVITALSRRAHMILDGEPHVLDDDLGFRLADVPEVLAAAGFPPGEAWLEHPAMQVRPWRASIVARARLVEDLVADRSRNGLSQVIILGAGLDTFALRHTQEGDALRVFEVDHPQTQHWKQARLHALGLPVPKALRFAPFDFESGGSWVTALGDAGFDPASPAVVALAGLTQYLTQDAIQQTMRDVAGLAPATTYVATFIVSPEAADPADRELIARTAQINKARGTPWLSIFTPDQFAHLAQESGLHNPTIITSATLTDRYFTGRGDALRPCSGEQILTAAV